MKWLSFEPSNHRITIIIATPWDLALQRKHIFGLYPLVLRVTDSNPNSWNMNKEIDILCDTQLFSALTQSSVKGTNWVFLLLSVAVQRYSWRLFVCLVYFFCIFVNRCIDCSSCCTIKVRKFGSWRDCFPFSMNFFIVLAIRNYQQTIDLRILWSFDAQLSRMSSWRSKWAFGGFISPSILCSFRQLQLRKRIRSLHFKWILHQLYINDWKHVHTK